MDIKSKGLFNKAVNMVTLASFLMWNMAFAAPVGGSVAQGSATIVQGGTQTTVVQTTPNAVINWQGFNTNANESVNFYQPGSSSVVLNRITSGTPTSFAGQLTANGQVWILNPAGVLFTSTSKIDVAGLVATTLNISDSNFMSHNYQLSQSPNFGQSSVINNGLITAHDNGLVALVAPTVENNGTIVANMGKVLLASGVVATLDPFGDDLINFAPDNYAVEGSVTNNGTISANGGKVVIAANSVNKIIKDVVNNGGFIEANNAVASKNGVVILGGNSGTTNIGGTIKSNRIVVKGHDTVISGTLKTQDGGYIETSGDTVNLTSTATIDAGKGGLWYMDPLDINLSSYGNVIQNQLNAGTNVMIYTGTNLSIPGSGTITMDVPLSWDTPAVLTLAAYGSITVTQPINIFGTGVNGNGSGEIILRPDVTGTNPSIVTFSGAGHINTNTFGTSLLFYDPPNGYNNPINYSSSITGNGSNARQLMMINNQTEFNSLMSLAAVAPQYTGVLTYNYNLNTNVSYAGAGPMFITYGGIFDGHNYVTGANSTITTTGDITGAFAGIMGTFAGELNGVLENVNITVSGAVNNSSSAATEVGGVVGDMTNGQMYNVNFTGNITTSGATLTGGIVGGMQNSILDNTNYVSGELFAVAGTTVGGIVGADYDSNEIVQTVVGSGVTIVTFGVGTYGGIIGAVQGPNSTILAYDITLNPVADIEFPAGTKYGGIVGILDSGSSLIIENVYAGNQNTLLIPSGTFDQILGSNGNGGANNVQTFGQPLYYTNSGNCGVVYTCNNVLFPESTFFASNPFVIPNPTYPDLPTTNLGAGALSAASSQTVNVYSDNTLIASPTSDGSGVYVFNYNPNLDPNFFIATTSGTVNGLTIKKYATQSSSPLAGLNISDATLTVISDLSNPISNADLAGLSFPSFYSASGNNLTLASGISFLTTSTTPFNLLGNITAPSGDITFGGPVTVSADSIVTSGTGNVLFSNTIGGSSSLTVSAAGTATFDGAVSGINNLMVTGATFLNTTSLSTVGTQTYVSPVTLSGNTVLASSSGNINFLSTVDGAFDLTLNAPAAGVIFGGTVGGISPLASLTVDIGGAIQQSGPIIVSGASSFSAGLFINLINTGNSFGGPVTLSTTGANYANIYNSTDLILAASTNIGSDFNVTVAAGKTITLNGDVTSGASQNYHGPVLLAADAILSSPTDVIHFYNTVDGAHNLTVSGFVTVFDDAVGSITPLSSLTINATAAITQSGPFFISGASIFDVTNGTIILSNANNSFGGAITLNGGSATLTNTLSTTLTASSITYTLDLVSGGPISQTGPLTVGGASSFDAGANTINLSNANNSFGGAITLNNTGSNNVTVNNTIATAFATSSVGGNLIVTSGGAITQTGALTVNGTSNFSAGANAITLTDTSNDFGGAVTLSNSGANDVQIYNNAPLTLTQFLLGGNITVTTDGSAVTLNGTGFSGGAQTYNAPLILGSATNLTGGGNIDFTNTIDGAGFNLTTNTPVSFDTQIHGDITNVNVLLVNGDVDINANVSTLSSQTYNGLVTLSTNANLNAASGNIDFVYGVAGAGFDLSTTTVSPFTTAFDGPVSGVNNLTVTGSADMNNGNVSTTGNQIYDGVVNLNTNTNLSSSGGDIHFMNDINGGGFNLSTSTVNPFSTIFDANVNNVNNLTVDGAATFPNATAINASGTVSFDNALNGPGSVDITAADTQISGSVGGVPPLSAFTVNGPIEFNGGVINANTQTYNGVVTILSSLDPTILNASGLIHFANSVEGPGSLTINAGNLQFDAGVGDITPLDVLTLNAPVTLNGSSQINANTEVFAGAVTVNGNADINSSGTVEFLGTVDGPGSLTVDAANTIIEGIVGGTTPLSLLDIINGITLNGAQITANQAIFEGPATIGVNGAIITSPDAEFLSTITGPGALSIIGNLIASGDINLGSLSVTGTTLLNKGSLQSIITQGNQFYGDTVTLNNDALFITYQGVIDFAGGGLYGPAYDVTIENFSHTFLNGIIGSVNVNNLTLGGTGGATLINSFFNSLTYDLFSIGTFCINGSCSSVNQNTAAQQVFVLPNISVLTNGSLEIIPGYVGTVTDVSGFVEVTDANGTRIVMPGDVLFAGETILTGPDGKLCFVTVAKAKVCLGPSQEYKV